MSAELLYSEIFEEFQKASTKQERQAVLRKHDHNALRDFLRYALDPRVIFDVEIPDYRPALEPAGMNYTYLNMEVPKLYRFIKDHPKRSKNLTAKKQQELLRVILEALHKDEADLLVRAMKKDLKIKFLTAKFIIETLPGI
jgi:hypothetical protein